MCLCPPTPASEIYPQGRACVIGNLVGKSYGRMTFMRRPRGRLQPLRAVQWGGGIDMVVVEKARVTVP